PCLRGGESPRPPETSPPTTEPPCVESSGAEVRGQVFHGRRDVPRSPVRVAGNRAPLFPSRFSVHSAIKIGRGHSGTMLALAVYASGPPATSLALIGAVCSTEECDPY